MSCYLCAYLLNYSPSRTDARPWNSPVGADQALGTCHVCSVWACSTHGTRYEPFECAICTPAEAVKYATGIGADQVAAEIARTAANSDVPTDLDAAISSLTPPDRREVVVGSMQEQIPEPSDTSARLSPYGFHAPNPRVIGAAARSAFGNGRLAPRSDAAVIVWGAFNLAYSIADPEFWPSAIQRPWNVPYPQLIDPVLWLVETALYLQRL